MMGYTTLRLTHDSTPMFLAAAMCVQKATVSDFTEFYQIHFYNIMQAIRLHFLREQFCEFITEGLMHSTRIFDVIYYEVR